jgi:hypothetical protein
MKPLPAAPAEDPLDALLRAPRPAIPDDGFTGRVLAALPPRPAPAPRIWDLRTAILLGATVVGCLLFGWLGLPALLAWPVESPLPALLPVLAAAAAALAALGGALFALVEES